MKKIAPIAALALLAVSFTSCKKNYKCTCTYSVSGVSSSVSYDLGKQKKSDAESACSSKATSVGGMTYTCKLD